MLVKLSNFCTEKVYHQFLDNVEQFEDTFDFDIINEFIKEGDYKGLITEIINNIDDYDMLFDYSLKELAGIKAMPKNMEQYVINELLIRNNLIPVKSESYANID